MSAYKTTRYNHQQNQRQPSPSKNFIYSGLSVQDDQKEIIISKLREEITLLKKNEEDFQKMKDHYTGLQHEFSFLSQEKKSNDDNFAKHHEAALRHISQIKNEIDGSKAEQREKKLQIEDLKTDENVLKNQLDLKYIEIQKLKNDLNSALADNEELCNEHLKLVQIHKQASEEKQRRSNQAQKYKTELESIGRKTTEVNTYSNELKKVQKAVTDRILNYQEDNNKIDEDIAATCEDLAIISQEIDNSSRQISELQAQIAAVTSQAQKHKSQAFHFKKAAQAEVMKNNELSSNISQAQNLFNVRKNQVKEGHREIQSLNDENISLQKINSQLLDDLEACRQHLQNMVKLNNDLVEKMHHISEEDEEVRYLIDRKDRVGMAARRVEEAEQQRKGIYPKKEPTSNDTRESSFRSSPYSSSRMRRYDI